MVVARVYRLLCAAAFGFGALASTGTARGDEIAAQLDYVAAPGCPAASDFQALVVRRLGRDPFPSDATERVVVRIEVSGAELVGRFEWKTASGKWLGDRVFSSRSRDCHELVRVMGFTLALQVQLMSGEASPKPQRIDAPKAIPPTEPAPSEPPMAVPPILTRSESPVPPSRLFLAIGGGASVAIGLGPRAIALGRVFGTLAWSHVALELGAELSVPSSMHWSNGEGFSEQLILGSLAACGQGSVLSACLLSRFGEIRVAGEGVNQPLVASGALFQTGARVSVTHVIGHRAQIGAHADTVVQVTRGRVTLDGVPIWTAPRLAADLGIDIAVRFP
jgi:hypothetical protein